MFPFFHLLLGGAFRRFLVAEFRDQGLRLLDVPVEYGVRLQFVHVLGQPVLELFQFLLVYMVGLPHQLKAQAVFHAPRFGYAFLQFLHADKLFRVVGLHFDVEGTAQEYHDLCGEVMHPYGGEGFRIQTGLPDE